MEAVPLIITMLSSYLVGAISFSRLVTKLLDPNIDLENVNMPAAGGNEPTRLRTVSATTASIKFGGKVGCAIALLDILKVSLPVLVFKLLFPTQYYHLIAGIAGMVGHIWPVYYRFRGGGGLSSLYGAWLVIDWPGALFCSFAGLALGLVVVRDVFVAYLAGVWLMIPWMWFRFQDPIFVVYAVIMNILFMLALVPEIRQALQDRKEGKQVDMAAAMATFPMGRGMLKIMQKLHLK